MDVEQLWKNHSHRELSQISLYNKCQRSHNFNKQEKNNRKKLTQRHNLKNKSFNTNL
jgi:hypothetical protein